MVQNIDIEINDYSGKLGLSDVERTITSAVNDFPHLTRRIDKLSVFVFDSRQIQEGIDIEEIRFQSGLPVRSEPKWDLMYSWWSKNIGLIEVNIEKFMNSSSIRRKFIARHELGHIFLSGPPDAVTLKDVSIDNSLKGIVDSELKTIRTIWKEYKVNSLMMRLFSRLTLQYMYENTVGYSQSKDREILKLCQIPFERLLVAIRLIIICEGELAMLEKAPSSLRKKVWKSIKKLHSERMAVLKRQAFQIRPELRDVRRWFPEECLENKELLKRRVLELCLPS
jgi:hypothetical protein